MTVCVGVCELDVSATACVSMSQCWWAGSEPCPSCGMPLLLGQEWLSFSPEADDNSTADPEEWISHSASQCLSGRIRLLLLDWVRCWYFHQRIACAASPQAFAFNSNIVMFISTWLCQVEMLMHICNDKTGKLIHKASSVCLYPVKLIPLYNSWSEMEWYRLHRDYRSE